MKIYAAEIEAGLEEQIKSSASVTYASVVEKGSDGAISASQKKRLSAQAGINDKDLYYTQSILVTTNWNKNDDIFDNEEVWAAKETPVHKPTNIEHKETEIVGHITANWPITEEGLYIDYNTPMENLPERFHILTASVIYTGFTDPEMKQRIAKLISEIEDGTKYVSMECFFQGFDYGLSDKSTGEFKVLARNETTAFLTKHLRAYGGMGEHENYKVGRVLRGITFSGKGFVDKPANPESIIFDKEDFKFENSKSSNKKNQDINETGVFSNQAENKEATMSSEAFNPNIKEGEAMSDCSEVVAEAVASVEEVKAKASELETLLATEKEEHANLKAAYEAILAEKEEAAKNSAETLASIQAELDAANEVIAAYKNKEEEMKKKEAMMKRRASLIEAGLDEETASSSLEKFESLDDESFENMVNLLAAMKPKMPPSEDDKKGEDKQPEDKEEMKKKNASEDVDLTASLETAEISEEVDLSVASETAISELENTRAALVDFVCHRLGKTLNK